MWHVNIKFCWRFPFYLLAHKNSTISWQKFRAIKSYTNTLDSYQTIIQIYSQLDKLCISNSIAFTIEFFIPWTLFIAYYATSLLSSKYWENVQICRDGWQNNLSIFKTELYLKIKYSTTKMSSVRPIFKKVQCPYWFVTQMKWGKVCLVQQGEVMTTKSWPLTNDRTSPFTVCQTPYLQSY